MQAFVLGELVEQANHDQLPAAVPKIAFAEVLDPVVAPEHLLGAVLRRVLGLPHLPLRRRRLRREPLRLHLRHAAPGGATRRLGFRLGRRRGALLLPLLLTLPLLFLLLLFLVFQFRQLDLDLSALCLRADQDLEDGAVDLVKQLNRRLLGCDQHGFDEVIKGERVKLENLAVDVQCVPRLQQRTDRLHQDLVAEGRPRPRRHVDRRVAAHKLELRPDEPPGLQLQVFDGVLGRRGWRRRRRRLGLPEGGRGYLAAEREGELEWIPW